MTVHRITDFSLWDLRDQFSDYEAAYLWLGFEPSYSNEHPSNVIGLRLALSEAQQRGELRDQTPSYRHVSYDKWGRERGMFVAMSTHYSRLNLRRYAEHQHQRPLFLFPEDRPAPSVDLPSKDAQRLPMVLAIAKDLGINPLDIPRGGKATLRDEAMSRHPRKITDSIFEQIWNYGKREGLLKMRKL